MVAVCILITLIWKSKSLKSFDKVYKQRTVACAVQYYQYECSLAMTCWILAVGGGGNSTGRLWYCLLIDLAPD